MIDRSTIIAVCCYEGDADRVNAMMSVHTRSGHPVIILSPEDSQVKVKGHLSLHGGKRAYIGEDSLQRQLRYFEILLSYPHKFFLLNDSDSMMLSAEVPEKLYNESENVIWSNEVVEPRPHESPYPKLAFQPPYFLTRESIQKMLDVAPRVHTHPITPYVDWYMNALSFEAGLKHRPFTDLEHPSQSLKPFRYGTPWDQLEYRIKYTGTNFVHPIKTQQQISLCRNSRRYYERQQS